MSPQRDPVGMTVVATAGHVDHGKSTLVRALTGMEPDRWAEERRRGLTIDLGYAWTRLSDAVRGTGPDAGPAEVAFVDVPGHRRFIGNMLAGLGPAPAVMLVVAADEGWREQTEEHLLAVEALRLGQGLIVVTRSDLADPGPALGEARERVARGWLGQGRSPEQVPAVSVSARTGAGLPELERALAQVCRSTPPVPSGATARLRLWADRVFTVRGSGTIVTGTLESGQLHPDQELTLARRAPDGSGTQELAVTVRSLQSLGSPVRSASAISRVAVNLRGVPAGAARRGDVLLSPGRWLLSSEVDVLLDVDAADLPSSLTLHVGAAHLPVRLRPLAGGVARLRLGRPLPLQPGDRAILRVPGKEGSIVGLGVLDVAPPPLTRSGSARRRGAQLIAESETVGEAGQAWVTLPELNGLGASDRSAAHRLATELDRRGHLSVPDARLLGLDPNAAGGSDGQVILLGEHLLSPGHLEEWRRALIEAVDEQARADPLEPRLSLAAARDRVRLPDVALVEALAVSAGLEVRGGRVARPGTQPDLGAAQAGLDAVLASLDAHPFAAPEAEELARLGLGSRELAAAESRGDLLRIAEGVVLLPRSPALAMRTLSRLPGPFTASEARLALVTSRRVAIPLLELLDARGWTRRIDAGHRIVVR